LRHLAREHHDTSTGVGMAHHHWVLGFRDVGTVNAGCLIALDLGLKPLLNEVDP